MSRVSASLALASPAWRRLRWTVAGVGGADLGEPLGDLGPDQGRVGEQVADVVPDDVVEVVGADWLARAHPAVLVAVVIRAEAAVVVDDLGGGASRGAVVGVAAAGAD